MGGVKTLAGEVRRTNMEARVEKLVWSDRDQAAILSALCSNVYAVFSEGT